MYSKLKIFLGIFIIIQILASAIIYVNAKKSYLNVSFNNGIIDAREELYQRLKGEFLVGRCDEADESSELFEVKARAINIIAESNGFYSLCYNE